MARAKKQKAIVESPALKPFLCEVAWEVCQQVGGIYTVIRSKAYEMLNEWGNRYVAIGPYNPQTAPGEFEEAQPQGVLADVIERMRSWGMTAKFGKWLIQGQPPVVLMDLTSVRPRMGEIKYSLWEKHRIGLPPADALLDDVVAFGYMVEKFFHALASSPLREGLPIIGHFHEWMSASCIPELRRTQVPMSIVFTTHATLLGRYLAMNDPWFYDHVPFVDWVGDAKRFNIEPQVRIERAAAHGAHVLTTVSEITGFECEHMVGRRPDVLVPNGLNIERFAAVHEFQNLHREYKQRIHQFVMGHFFPSYTFDLDTTLYFFSSGRYEYRNKGYDLTLEALARLNARMKAAGTDRTVVFMLVAPRPFRSINAEVLQSHAHMEEMRRLCEQIQKQAGERLFLRTVEGKTPDMDSLVDDHLRLQLRRMRYSWKISRLPAIVTHDLVDDTGNEALSQMRASNLINWEQDKVKVIYYPNYVTTLEPLIGLDYGQFVRGCHLGIFPSYYEPWGYTPLECMARGVPAVTSDLSGFGTYLMKHMPDHKSLGLYIVHRRNASFDAAANELTDVMFNFVQLDRRERIALRNRLESSSDHFDWSNLLRHYWDAYDLALRRTGQEGRLLRGK